MLRAEGLEDRRMLSIDGIVAAFNQGVAHVRNNQQIVSIVDRALGVDLPMVLDKVSEIVNAVDKFTAPFRENLLPAQVTDEIRTRLESLGFSVEYVGLVPDASGDLLRATYARSWNLTPEEKLLDIDFRTGFEYFDRGVAGDFVGTASATVHPVTMSVTLGVDLVNGTPTFWVGESSNLSIEGVSISGSIEANLAIRNLLDVDVLGPVDGRISGGITFDDGDAGSTRLRVSQWDSPGIVQSTLAGFVEFKPSLRAELPIIGDVEWAGVFSRTVENGVLTGKVEDLTPPTTALVEQLLRKGYKEIAGAFDFFSGVNLGGNLPVVNKPITEVLGLPSFLTGGVGPLADATPDELDLAVADVSEGNRIGLIAVFTGTSIDRQDSALQETVGQVGITEGTATG